MNNEKIMTLQEALFDIADKSATAWIYLPANKSWNLDSNCAILESDEVPPELEDDPDAGVPEFAKRNNLIQALPVTVVQDIMENTRAQKFSATLEDFFRALVYYYKHDAFIDINHSANS